MLLGAFGAGYASCWAAAEPRWRLRQWAMLFMGYQNNLDKFIAFLEFGWLRSG
jgi:hypothetical protein